MRHPRCTLRQCKPRPRRPGHRPRSYSFAPYRSVVLPEQSCHCCRSHLTRPAITPLSHSPSFWSWLWVSLWPWHWPHGQTTVSSATRLPLSRYGWLSQHASTRRGSSLAPRPVPTSGILSPVQGYSRVFTCSPRRRLLSPGATGGHCPTQTCVLLAPHAATVCEACPSPAAPSAELNSTRMPWIARRVLLWMPSVLVGVGLRLFSRRQH